MTNLENQIWELVHNWCEGQYCEIPDPNRRVLMERILTLFQSLVNGSLPSVDKLDDNAVPVRIQRSRKHKQVSPNGLPIVYVGRGTRWGNPFRLVKYSDGKWAIKTDGSDRCNDLLIKHCHAVYDTKAEAAIDAIKCYNYWLLPYTHKEGSIMEFYQSMAQIKAAIASLKGKNLSCWCRLDEKCHSDLLLELANKKLK